jgi:magnesium transporter
MRSIAVCRKRRFADATGSGDRRGSHGRHEDGRRREPDRHIAERIFDLDGLAEMGDHAGDLSPHASVLMNVMPACVLLVCVWSSRVGRIVGDRHSAAAAVRSTSGCARIGPCRPGSLQVPNLLQRSRLRPGRAVDLAVGPPAEEVQPDEVSASGVRWLYLEKPREGDREWLQREFGFHALDIEDVASRNQRPKLDAYDDYLFIVLHFPVFDKPSGRLLTAELDLFVGPDYLITLPDQNLPPLAAMFERYRERDEVREATFSKGTGYLLYRIVDTCVDASFPMLRKLGAKLDELEDDIFEGRSDKIVQDISNAKQEIINFRRVVRPMRAVLRDLERTKQRYLAEDLDIYFDDITDAAERIWDVLENYKEVAEALEDSNESVLSHRLNESLRVLTAFSVALLPLTLLASIFGMNFDLPGEEGLGEFWLVIVLMGTILLGVLLFFRRRGYL